MTRRNPLASCRALSVAAGLLASAITSFAAIPAARAEILQLAAAAFTPRGTAIVPATQGEVVAGMLGNATGKYYATVPFPVGQMNVCSFSLWYHDNDAGENVTAKLLRKRVIINGNAFAPPVTMAQVASAGAFTPMKRASTTAITNPVIAPGAAIYYVEIDIPTSSLEVVGVQIMYRTTCP